MSQQLDLFQDRDSASGAMFSPDRTYRYLLWRRWDASLPMLGWVMNNPSDAGEFKNDPTIHRVIHRSKLEGYGGALVANAYAFGTPSPATLWEAQDRGIDIVGPENNTYLETLPCPVIVLAYGNLPRPERVAEVLALLDGRDLRHLGLTASGRPKHPLARGRTWIPDSQPMERMVPAREGNL